MRSDLVLCTHNKHMLCILDCVKCHGHILHTEISWKKLLLVSWMKCGAKKQNKTGFAQRHLLQYNLLLK